MYQMIGMRSGSIGFRVSFHNVNLKVQNALFFGGFFCLPCVLHQVTVASVCLWGQFDETWKGSTHDEINIVVASSVCQTVNGLRPCQKAQSLCCLWQAKLIRGSYVCRLNSMKSEHNQIDTLVVLFLKREEIKKKKQKILPVVYFLSRSEKENS